jgi:putative sugar O-methyltransferase
MSDELILTRARDFYSKVSRRYSAEKYYERLPLNTFWQQQNMPLMLDIIENADGAKHLVHRAHQTFMFSVNVEAPIKERAVDWLLDELRSRSVDIFLLPPEIQESVYSYPGNNVDRRGRSLTPDFVRTVNIALQIRSYFKPDQRGFDILELGGGLGHLARTMNLLGNTRSHVIVDLPETLVFSFCFLSLNFPQARMVLVEDEESARSIAGRGYDFAFVPALFAEAITAPPYDLFVNTASLGEMPNKTIRYWMDFIQNRLDVRYLYTLNRYLNTIDPSRHTWRWEENECAVHYDRRWDILQWELEPRFTRCPYVDTLIARYVEIAASRLNSIEESECVECATELLRMVQEEDWYNVNGDSAIMTRGDQILAHDLSMDGTLFKLWNILRLHPTADAVETLLRYLDTFFAREDRVFEEQRYYEDLFFGLFNGQRDPQLEQFAGQVHRRRRLQARRSRLELIDASSCYNFVKTGDGVIAISKAAGSVKLFDERLGERELPPVLFTGESLEAVRNKAMAEEWLAAQPGAELMGDTPEYNLVKVGERFLALAKVLGPSRPMVERLGERELVPLLFLGESLEEVWGKALAFEKRDCSEVLAGAERRVGDKCESLALRMSAIIPESNDMPQLLQEDYRGFNLIAYEGKVWAAAMAAGPVDLHDTDVRKQLVAEGRLLEAMTVDGVRAAVDRWHDRQAIEAEMSNLRSHLVAQHAELASRHDAALSQLAQWREAIESRLAGDETAIREYSLGFFNRFAQWIRLLFRVEKPK